MDESPLTAVADDVARTIEAEGPAGGPLTRDRLEEAVAAYSASYGEHPPATLAAEVHRCRSLAVEVLHTVRADAQRRELRRSAGWLSALLGNLAFHSGDVSGARIHLATASRLGTGIGDHGLACWALGAESMVALFEDRPREALESARRARAYADTPLRRAQIAAWCELKPFARLAEHSAAVRCATRARHALDAAEDKPGRFGFDAAELHLHLAEAYLDMVAPVQAAEHARISAKLKHPGSGGWAAAVAVQARAAAARRDPSDACALAEEVLDTVPANRLRSTTRRRLDSLLIDLFRGPAPGREARRLHERLSTLEAPVPAPRTSPEPNGEHRQG